MDHSCLHQFPSILFSQTTTKAAFLKSTFDYIFPLFEVFRGILFMAEIIAEKSLPDLDSTVFPASLLSLDLTITHSLTGTVLQLSSSLHKCSEWP